MSGTFRGRATGLLLAFLGAAGGCAAALAADFGATGNQRAIRFYRSSQTAMARYATIRFTGGGTAYKLIRGSFDDFAYAFGSVPRTYSRATDSVVVVQRGGNVVEEIDTLSAKGLPPVRVWRDHPGSSAVGLVLDRKGCPVSFHHDNNSFVRVGNTFVSLGGIHFGALEPRGATTIVHSRYPSSGGTAYQTDTIGSASHLWAGSQFVLRGGAFSGASLSETGFSFSHRSAYQVPPALRRCP